MQFMLKINLKCKDYLKMRNDEKLYIGDSKTVFKINTQNGKCSGQMEIKIQIVVRMYLTTLV